MRAARGGDQGRKRTEAERLAEAPADGVVESAGGAAARTRQSRRGSERTCEQSERWGVEGQDGGRREQQDRDAGERQRMSRLATGPGGHGCPTARPTASGRGPHAARTRQPGPKEAASTD